MVMQKDPNQMEFVRECRQLFNNLGGTVYRRNATSSYSRKLSRGVGGKGYIYYNIHYVSRH